MITSIHASKLDRIMNCAGSMYFKDLPEPVFNEAAEEGVAASQALECYLKGEEIPQLASNGYRITEEMIFYAHNLNKEIKSFAETNIKVEKSVDWKSQNILIKSRYDLSFTVGNTLYVDDYKYGWGLVEPKENYQLIAYAIGEIISQGVAYDKIVMRIHQPRPYHENGSTREWTITYNELLTWKQKIDDRMKAINQGENSLVTGKHCKYCPAAAHCPSFNSKFYQVVEVVKEFNQHNVADNDIALKLDLISDIEDIFKTYKSSLEMLAINRLKEGKILKNYIIEENFGNRNWKNDISPDAIKLMTGKDITEKIMLSPAKAEKLGVPKVLIDQMTYRKSLGPKLKRKDVTDMANKIFNKE